MHTMLTLLLGFWLSLGPQLESAGALQGVVKRGGASESLAGVEVSLILADRGIRLRTTSDDQGRFAFFDLPPGKYSVNATREGYFTYPQGRPLPANVASVTIEALQTRQLTVDLMPGAVISGRLTDSEGRPLPGVAVSAMTLEYDEGRPAFDIGSVPKTTNERGEYRLFWFPPGEYYIRAEVANAQSNLARKSYYPGTMDSAMAQPLIVRGGEALDGMDFMVPTASAVLISGRVVPEASGPATGVVRTFYLLPRDGRPMEAYPAEFKNMRTPAAGQDNTEFSLEVRGLAPGLYDLAPFFIDSDNQYHSGRTRIEIGDRNIEDLAVPPGANVHVQGRIVVEGEKSFQDWGGLQLQLRAKEPAVPLMQRSNTARIMPDGTFSIPAVFEGLYQIHLYAGSRSRSKDLYVSAIRQGGLDLRDEGSVDVRPSMLPLEITLSSGTGIVRGVVDAAAGETPSYAHVVLIPQASRRANALFYDRTTIDDRGRFVFQGVAPGEYKVFAFERLADTAERNPAFLARYETLGSSVTVNPGITTEIRVRFVR